MKLYLLLILLFQSFSIAAQTECGTGEAHARLLATSNEYRLATEKAEQAWRNTHSDALQKIVVEEDDTLYEIPVVFHVIHKGQPVGDVKNPADSQLVNLIDYVNKAFAAEWPAYPHVNHGGVYVPFRFVLAGRSPQSKYTEGINRADGSKIEGYAQYGVSDDNEHQIKYLSCWPNDRYYNIWIIDSIKNGFSGYAYYPGAGPGLDGTVIKATAARAGNPVLVHELGHAMGLRHTFEGDEGNMCPPKTNCWQTGDLVCDTEPDKRYPDCGALFNHCTGQPYNFIQQNFMNYSKCSNRFTAGQKERMLFQLKNSRPQLMNAESAPVDTVDFFPNPATTHLTIISHNDSATVNIRSASGHLLLSDVLVARKQQLNISQLPAGLYIIGINSKKYNLTKKFIKQ